jgi:hypothetical protein
VEFPTAVHGKRVLDDECRLDARNHGFLATRRIISRRRGPSAAVPAPSAACSAVMTQLAYRLPVKPVTGSAQLSDLPAI